MSAYRVLLLGVVGATLTACAANHVGFVTSTSIGIGADASTGKTSVAYSRDELFVGPSYPDGGIPPVLGTQTTNGDIINNVQHQTLATGDAAIIISNEGKGALGILASQIISQRNLCKDIPSENSADKQACDQAVAKMWETRKEIADALLKRQWCALNAGCKGSGETSLFGTQTDLGLTIQADPKSWAMSKVLFGFQRKEATLAPVSQKADGSNSDSFPSMLALFGADYDVGVDKSCWENREMAPEKPPTATQPNTGTLSGEGAAGTSATTPPQTPAASSGTNCGAEDASKPPVRRYGYGIAQVIATGAAADGIARSAVGSAIRTQIVKTAAGSDTSGKTQQQIDQTPAEKAKEKTAVSQADSATRLAQLSIEITAARTAAAEPSTPEVAAAEIKAILAAYGLEPGQSNKFSETKNYGSINEVIKAYNEANTQTPRLPADPDATLKDTDKVSDFESMLSKNAVLRKFFAARVAQHAANG